MPLPIPNHEFNFNRDLNVNNGLFIETELPANIIIQGDINDGGHDDFLIRFQPYHNNYYRKVYIYFGEENRNWQETPFLSPTYFSPASADIVIINSLRTSNTVQPTPVHSAYSDCDINGDDKKDLFVSSNFPHDESPPLNSYYEMYAIFGGDWLVSNTTIDVGKRDFKGLIVRGNTIPVRNNAVLEGLFCGDINGDNINDLVVGVRYGENYFSRICIIYNTPFLEEQFYLLDELDGKNGTCIDIRTLSPGTIDKITIGDVDANGYDDLLIIVPYAGGSRGHFQVDILFGDAISSGDGQISWTSLAQHNGRASIRGLDTSALYYTGHHFTAVPLTLIKPTDLDGDQIVDVIIRNAAAFPHYGNYDAIIYSLGQMNILPGHVNLRKEKIIDLNSAISNKTAYRLDGVKLNGRLGSSSTTFDMNNDYYSDIVLSAPSAAYNLSAGIDSLLTLSGEFSGELNLLYGGKDFTQWLDNGLHQIDGLNGFRITLGRENRAGLGYGLCSAGDINNDGIIDLLFSIGGTYEYSYNYWPKYAVMYGNAWPVFHVNQLMFYSGQGEVLLDASNLNVTDANDPEDQLEIIVDSIHHGYFAKRDNATLPLSKFKMHWIYAGDIVFIHQGTLAPEYSLNATDGKMTVGPVVAEVIYSAQPEWVNKNFDLVQGSYVTPVSSDMLQAVDNIADAELLQIQVVETQRCYFAYKEYLQQSLSGFSQHQVDMGEISLVCDGERSTPVINLNVSNGFTNTGTTSVDISYKQSPLILLHPLEINQGEAKILSAKEIQFFDEQYASTEVLVAIQHREHGHFFLSHQPEVPIDSFTQQQFDMGWVGVTHNDSDSPLAYSLTTQVEDAMSKPYPAVVNFNWRPVLQTNYLETEQGKATRVTSTHLSASDKNGDDGQLIFYPHTQGGYFAWADDMRQINEFTQYAIWGGKLRFVTYDTGAAPYCEIRVGDGRIVTSPEITTIDFKPTPLWEAVVAPSLIFTFSIAILGFAIGCYRSKRSRDNHPHVKYFVQELGLQTSDLTSVAGAGIVNFVSDVFLETKNDERFSNYIDNRQVKERFMMCLVQQIQRPQRRKLLAKAGCFDRVLSSCSAYGPYQLDLPAAYHQLSELVDNTKQAFISTHGAPQVVASQDVRPASPVIERPNRSCWQSFCSLFGQGNRSVMASEIYQSLSESSVRVPQ